MWTLGACIPSGDPASKCADLQRMARRELAVFVPGGFGTSGAFVDWNTRVSGEGQ